MYYTVFLSWIVLLQDNFTKQRVGKASTGVKWNEINADITTFLIKNTPYFFFKINMYLIYNYNTVSVL
jgi:hypothetical protein